MASEYKYPLTMGLIAAIGLGFILMIMYVNLLDDSICNITESKDMQNYTQIEIDQSCLQNDAFFLLLFTLPVSAFFGLYYISARWAQFLSSYK